MIPKTKHQRTTVQLADKLKTDIYNFYLRDDISYQLPGIKDTLVIKEDDASKVIYQKRTLVSNLCETYVLFKEENDQVYIIQSSFAELIPAFLIEKAASIHRNCLWLYHENICLLLKVLDKHAASKCCSPLQTFTDSLVYNSTSGEECMFSSCSLCKNVFTEKIEENITDDNVKNASSQRTKEHGRGEKEEFSENVDEAVLLLKSKAEYFLCHMYIKEEETKG